MLNNLEDLLRGKTISCFVKFSCISHRFHC